MQIFFVKNQDVGLDDGVGDSEYLRVLEDRLPDVLDSFRPDLVLYDAGVDVHAEDELGRLGMTDGGIFRRDEYVIR